MEAIGLFIDAFSDAVSLEHLFQIFVENEMDHRLRYAEIGRTDAFIESQKSLEERREEMDPSPIADLPAPRVGVRGVLSIEVAPFFQKGVGACCAWIQKVDGQMYTQGWVLGRDMFSAEPPEFLLEYSVLQALSLVLTHIKEEGTECRQVLIKAGNWRVMRALARWFRRGELLLISSAASDIIRCFYEILPMTKCPIILRALPPDHFAEVCTGGSRGCDILYVTAKRLYNTIIPQGLILWGERICRIPWNAEEVKAHLLSRYQVDEARFISLLSSEGSIASQIFTDLKLNREVLRIALNSLKFSRKLQVTMGSIICATRFKYFDKAGNILPVSCPKCKKEDSFEHLLGCAELELPSTGEESSMAEFLRHMAVKAVGGNPGLPTPILSITEGEIDLSWSVSSNDEISF